MWLADLILIIHFCIIFFVISVFLLVPIGYGNNWIWIKNRKLRYIHIFIIGFVSMESIFGLICPLTVIENKLRGKYFYDTFVNRYL